MTKDIEVIHNCTFWKLISENYITIPMMQRDYAQGRAENKNGKIFQIRNNFLDAIIEAVENEAKSKNLDLVYGNKKHLDGFVPIDGQQRLTTLFLLHWYLAMRSSNLKNFEIIFTKFSYKTRTSSKDFCEAIAKSEFSIKDNDILSKKISNSPWFALSWIIDPTIKSMLVVLDAIHLKMKGKNHSEFWMKLVNSERPPLTFQFFNMGYSGFPDSLYIKMNARGKQLTEFENFKAWFEEFIHPIVHDDKTNEIANKFDNQWTDLFWKYRDAEKIDAQFINFINGIAFVNNILWTESNLIKTNPVQDEYGTLNDLYTENRDQALKYLRENEQYIAKDVYRSSFDTLDKIEVLETSLDNLCKNESIINPLLEEVGFWELNTSLFSQFITKTKEHKGISVFYAILRFLNKLHQLDDENSKVQFKRFMRVIRNIVENATIDSNDSTKGALILIKELAENSVDIYLFLSRSEIKSGFAKDQVAEEVRKAKLIIENSNYEWEQAIITAESHKLLKGRIGFLLDYVEPFEGQEKINKFIKYIRIANEFFAVEIVNKNLSDNSIDELNNSWLTRAILTCGEYSNIWSFGFKTNWKDILKQNKNETISLFFKNVETYITAEPFAMLTAKKFIDNWLVENEHSEKKWIYYFIKYEDMTQPGWEGYNNYVRLSESDKNTHIRILTKSRMSSYNFNPYIKTLGKKLCLDSLGYTTGYEKSVLSFDDFEINIHPNEYSWIIEFKENVDIEVKKLRLENYALVEDENNGHRFTITTPINADLIEFGVEVVELLN